MKKKELEVVCVFNGEEIIEDILLHSFKVYIDCLFAVNICKYDEINISGGK